MSPPDADLPVRVAFLEDHVTELGVELQDHELRFRAIAAGGGVRDVSALTCTENTRAGVRSSRPTRR